MAETFDTPKEEIFFFVFVDHVYLKFASVRYTGLLDEDSPRKYSVVSLERHRTERRAFYWQYPHRLTSHKET